MSANNRRREIRGVRRRRGQGMTEYIVLVGLIAILLIAAVTKFRDAVGNAFNTAASKIENDISKPIQSTMPASG
jgi:Flp pilus assembly pilin Flp